ncbi:MAG: thiamine phosphate synthase [Rhodobacteraceae bacterium]|nr:thiamine phosphate synthase [Paracoccaceae bacterium]
MDMPEQPQIYLVTPPVIDLSGFPDRLAAVMDAHEIACIRIALAARDADAQGRAADALREVAHARDVAILITDHVALADRHGLDGVHLSDAGRSVRDARKALGPDASIGSFCAASRHDGYIAGEAGADYVSFGPVTETGLGQGDLADHALFEAWSLMVELPVVAEGGLTEVKMAELAPVTDLFAIGDEIWSQDDPVAALRRLIAAMGAGA